jgi:hypothetical protein
MSADSLEAASSKQPEVGSDPFEKSSVSLPIAVLRLRHELRPILVVILFPRVVHRQTGDERQGSA